MTVRFQKKAADHWNVMVDTFKVAQIHKTVARGKDLFTVTNERGVELGYSDEQIKAFDIARNAFGEC